MPSDPGAVAAVQYTFGDNVHIQADVFGGTKQETNVYLLRATTKPVDWRGYRDRTRAPYRFLDSYDLLDAGIYTGRDADVDRLEREVLAYRLVVLQGPVGAGKTSLLRAGLTPRLMSRGYLVLYARDYTNPTEALINALAEARDQLRVDLSGVADLVGLARAAERSLDRPVVLALDHFENFFINHLLTSAGRERFRAELAAFCEAQFQHPACLILSLRQRSQGELAYFQGPAAAPAVPEIYHHVVPLDLLTAPGARAAALAPLAGLDPPMVFDPEFLDGRLLPALALPDRGEACIDPPHLQILCSALYDAARERGQQFINERLYEGLGRREGILGGYLQRTLSEEFPDPGRYELARTLLKAMVSNSGELVYLSTAEAAQRAEQPAEAIEGVLDALARRSLLLSRTERTFSLAHPIMAQTVLDWFDRREAEIRCAQETLDHAWYDWLAWDRLRRMAGDGEGAEETTPAMAPLLDRNRLPEIAACRDRLKIAAGQHALLLRSAVAVAADVTLWVRGLAADPTARGMVATLQAGHVTEADQPVGQFARVLGIETDLAEGNPLGRTILAHDARDTRHVAALAVAALGAEAIAGALRLDDPAARRTARQTWRVAQALAWMRVAGCQLPELRSAFLRGAVGLGERVLRFAAGWQGIAVEALAAALGAAAAYVVRALVMALTFPLLTFRAFWQQLFAIGLSSAWLGFAVGGVTVLIARFLAPEPEFGGRAAPAWRRVAAVAIGFTVGLALGLPYEWAFPSGYLPSAGRLLGRYVGSGLLMGAALAVGMSAAAAIHTRAGTVASGRWLGRRIMLGGALGAMIAGAILGWLELLTGESWMPAVTTQGSDVLRLIQSAWAGAVLGAGLCGGWAWGRRIWRRWQAQRGIGLFAVE